MRVNAHIKNENNKSIKLIIYNASTGVVERQKTFDLVPSPKSLMVVRQWLDDEYVQYLYTEEGFRPEQEPKIVTRDGRLAAEGSTVAKDVKRSATLPRSHVNRNRTSYLGGAVHINDRGDSGQRDELELVGGRDFDEQQRRQAGNPDGEVPGQPIPDDGASFTETPGEQSPTAPRAPATDCEPDATPDPEQPRQDPGLPDPDVPYNNNMLPNGDWRSNNAPRGSGLLRVNNNKENDPGPYQSMGATFADRIANVHAEFNEAESQAFADRADNLNHLSEVVANNRLEADRRQIKKTRDRKLRRLEEAVSIVESQRLEYEALQEEARTIRETGSDSAGNPVPDSPTPDPETSAGMECPPGPDPAEPQGPGADICKTEDIDRRAGEIQEVRGKQYKTTEASNPQSPSGECVPGASEADPDHEEVGEIKDADRDPQPYAKDEQNRSTEDSNKTSDQTRQRNNEAANTAKPTVQLEGLAKKDRQYMRDAQGADRLENQGMGGDHLLEPIPAYVQAKCEKVISGRNNTWIVLGRDRAPSPYGGRENAVGTADRTSGYGMIGHTQAGAIDIVVGRMSPNPRAVNDKDETIEVDPIFNVQATQYGRVTDAARIYISQKTNIDKNFNLVKGKVGDSIARSAIGIKADGVRIIAREGIKLVTQTDSINSQGGAVTRIRGVDIIAGNNDRALQPMVLGNNLTAALTEMANIVSALVGTTQACIENIAALDVALAQHIHVSPFFGAAVPPSPDLAPQCIASLVNLVSVQSFSNASSKWNLSRFKLGYLSTGSPNSIRSKHNNVN